MKRTFFLLFIIAIPLFTFCNTRNDIVAGKYWVRIKNDKTKGLVKFTNEGKYIYYEKLDKDYKYNILAHQFTFEDEDGDIKKYRIAEMNDNIIKLEDYEVEKENDTIIFIPASKHDYILGDWINLNNNNSKIEFKIDQIVEMKIERDTATVEKVREYKFIDEDNIFINNNTYTYSFEDDLTRLKIYLNDELTFNLIRESLKDRMDKLASEQ